MPITQNESLKEVHLITEPGLKHRMTLSMSGAFFHIKALSVPGWQAQTERHLEMHSYWMLHRGRIRLTIITGKVEHNDIFKLHNSTD